ncbi:tetratricopeptide repeat protein [Kroppenstedtia eburnea]|uniref:Tetratricopeptide repeat-containing protein n=1 Tax=Kroppenstedtia eburnea TaxID=714067 RepID=A0A1N7Q688_9BACL|nr:tetratricopeptide repeat protein [Kroppenstedtia eburnea]QKI83190.1 tetratricopeptide repeat protein [Kroppenstedtia eburnea]SIT18372.1 Tetratricopeptide repeat-containing protein [Kroppenstedtia eburnea]
MGNTPLFDELGHPIWMDREEFRTHVIPENIQADWDNPHNLYTFAVQLYKDGFLEEAEQGVNRLLELTDREEEVLLLQALVLMKEDKPEEGERVLLECIDKYPDRGVAHTYLARIFAARGDREQAVQQLKEGLSKEPNQETALRMFTEWVGDPEEAASFLEQLSETADSWWPLLELGKLHLKKKNSSDAMDCFQRALDRIRGDRAEESFPEWEEEVAAMTVSSLLRKEGLTEELIQFSEKYWTPAYMTPFHGMDYAQALFDSGNPKGAVDILARMMEYIEPDYQNMVRLRMQQLDRIPENA